MKTLQILKPTDFLTNRTTTALRAGKILTAQVKGFSDGGKVRLDIGGGRMVLAETSLNVQLGETVRVRVETVPGLINLKTQAFPDNKDKPIAETLKGLIGGGRTAVGLAPQLQRLATELLRLASIPQNLRPELAEQIQSIAKEIQIFDGRLRAEGFNSGLNGTAVKELVENSGLFLEARLAAGKDVSQDLKALLLKLQAVLELLQNPSKVVKGRLPNMFSEEVQVLSNSLKLAARAEIGEIESKQAMNLIVQNSVASTTVSVPLTGEFSKSKLIISEEKEEKKNKKNASKRYRVTLSLDMSRLGHIRADAVQSGKSMVIGFAVKDDKTYEFIESNLESLRAQVLAKKLPIAEIFLSKAEPESEPSSPKNSSQILSRKA